METLKLIHTNEEIQGLIDYLKDLDYIAYDTETTGLALNAQIVGLCVSADVELGWYVITAYWDTEAKELIQLDNRDKCKELLELLATKNLIMHNGTVDCNWTFRNYGIQLKEALHTDTMILAHLLDENRQVGLKELGLHEFGETAKKEQQEMRDSVIANGGIWEQKYDKKKKIWKDKKGGIKEMYKADVDVFGKYGAKDAILTLKIFYLYVPKLYDEGLDEFFYSDECMPLFKGPTYEMNTVGLRVDMQALAKLEEELIKEIQRLKADILFEITPHVKDKYPGTSEKNTFNIGATQQISWLLFIKLSNDWRKLTDNGRTTAKDLMGRAPYTPTARREFAQMLSTSLDKKGKPYQLHKLLKCNKDVLLDFVPKYKWCADLLKHNQLNKLLNTYVVGLKDKIEYGVIHPSFLQHGTTGGRYSSRRPNFQNLPRKDKRVKKFIVSRPGKSFVGADYSQLEPRVFASVSGDERLLKCFKDGDDFYSVIGIPVFKKFDCIPKKEGDPNAFGIKHPVLRDLAKGAALAAAYGTTAYRLSDMLRGEDGKNLPIKQTEQIIRDYFDEYPSVKQMQLKCHEQAMTHGVVYNLYGRPRRIPEAKLIRVRYGKGVTHADLAYEERSLLNLSVNHTIQSSAASIMNRAAILFYRLCKEANLDVQIVCQVHDELIVECADENAEVVKDLLKYAMENAVILPGIELTAEPKIAKNFADLK